MFEVLIRRRPTGRTVVFGATYRGSIPATEPTKHAGIVQRLVRQSATLVTRVRVPFSAPRRDGVVGNASVSYTEVPGSIPGSCSRLQKGEYDAQCHAQSGTGS